MNHMPGWTGSVLDHSSEINAPFPYQQPGDPDEQQHQQRLIAARMQLMTELAAHYPNPMIIGPGAGQASSSTKVRYRAGPLHVGSDHDLEARVVYQMLAHYGWLDQRCRVHLRELDRSLPGGTRDSKVATNLRTGAWRFLWPEFPIEFFTVRVGIQRYRSFLRKDATRHCSVFQCYRDIERLQSGAIFGAARWTALVVSPGRMPIEELPVVHNFLMDHHVSPILPLAELLGCIDRYIPRGWEHGSTQSGWNRYYPHDRG